MSPMRSAAIALVASVVGSAPAAAETPAPPPAPGAVVCTRERLPAPPDRPYPFYGPRVRELWALGGYLADFNGSRHSSFDAQFEWVFLTTPEQRWRIGVRGGVLGGYWGDDRHGPLSFELGVTGRGSFYMDDLIDLYGVAKAGGTLSVIDGARAGLRPGLGLGVRLLRAVLLEATFDPVTEVGSGFDLHGDSQPVIPAFGITLGLDFCGIFGCGAPKPRDPIEVDATCKLYTQALDLCVKRTPDERRAICAAVEEAMDADRHPRVDAEDSTEAFLKAVAAEAPMVAELLVQHRAMKWERECSASDAREAAQTRRSLATHFSYAPYPVEIRRALGCDDAAFACAAVARCAGP